MGFQQLRTTSQNGGASDQWVPIRRADGVVNDWAQYGTHAGWAHSLLFAGELPQFKARLPAELQEEMLAFKALEKQNKAEREAKRKKVREGKAGSSTRAPATKPNPAKPIKPKPAKVRKLADRA